MTIYWSSAMSLRPRLGFCPGGWCHSHFSYEKTSWRAQIIYPGPQVAYLHKGVSSSDLPGSKILILGFSILEVCWSLLSCTIAVWDSKPCLVTSPLPQKSPRISNNNTVDLQSVYWAEHRGCCNRVSSNSAYLPSLFPDLHHQHCWFFPPLCFLLLCTSWFQESQ